MSVFNWRRTVARIGVGNHPSLYDLMETFRLDEDEKRLRTVQKQRSSGGERAPM